MNLGKSWSASLTVSAVISLALLALYRFTEWFIHGAIWLEDLFTSVFVLPGGGAGLAFHQPVQYVFLAAMALVTTWVCMELPRVFSRLAYLAGAVFLTLLISPVLAFCGVLFEPFSGITAILLAGVTGFVLGGTEEGQRQHKLVRYFAGRISRTAFTKIVTAKEPFDISGRREMTVLTCRILNYPELTAQTEPHDLEQISTAFLRAAAEFLVSKGAYLDSCNAEGVRVFFGLLEKDSPHAVDACKAALELRQRLINLDADIQHSWHKKPIFGAAIATGPMSAGLYGFHEFQFYSAVGEPLDFSRRLCSVNLVYGSRVLISSRTFAMTKDQIEARPMEMVVAPRMHQISEVYELLAAKGSLSDEEVKSRDAFWQGVVSLRKGDFKEALAQLKKARINGHDDAPLQYFHDRAEAGLKEQEEAEGPKATARHVRMLTAN